MRWNTAWSPIGGFRRPVHSHLLGHDIPICEHMTNLESLPDTGAVFHAAPVKVRAMGTFPVQAYCACGAISGS